MRERLEKMPQALQKQVLFRAGGSVLFWALFIIILISFRDIYMVLPCLLLAGYLTGSSIWLYCQSVAGNYMHLQGECIRMETIGIRKRVRSVYLALEQGIVKIAVKQRIRRLSEGDTVSIYVAEKTPVYERDGIYIISSYYAMEIQGRCRHGKRKGNVVPALSGDQGGN